MNKVDNNQFRNQPTFIPKKEDQQIVEWIRSFEYSHCKLMKNISDLNSGVIFCEIVHELLFHRQKPEFLRRVFTHNLENQSNCIANLSIALSEIKNYGFELPFEINSLQPIQLYLEDGKKITLIKWLKNFNQKMIDAAQSDILQQQEQQLLNNQQLKQAKQNENNNNIKNKKTKLNAGILFFSKGENIEQQQIDSNQIDKNISNQQYMSQRTDFSNSNRIETTIQPIQENNKQIQNYFSLTSQFSSNKVENINNEAYSNNLYQQQNNQQVFENKNKQFKILEKRMSVDKDIKELEKSIRIEEQQLEQMKNFNSERKPLQSNVKQRDISKKRNASIGNDNNKQINQYKQYSPYKCKQQQLENIIITPVSLSIKQKIIDWLYSICLIKQSAANFIDSLPQICKNGVIFSDLINRVSGRAEQIKGIYRNPSNNQQVRVNYIKVLEYLRQFQKMNPRYLWALEYLIEGNSDIFYGLLDDIWHLYNNKNNSNDKRYQQQQISDRQHSQSSSIVMMTTKTLNTSEKKLLISNNKQTEKFNVNNNSLQFSPKTFQYDDICYAQCHSRRKNAHQKELFDTPYMFSQYNSCKKDDSNSPPKAKIVTDINDEQNQIQFSGTFLQKQQNIDNQIDQTKTIENNDNNNNNLKQQKGNQPYTQQSNNQANDNLKLLKKDNIKQQRNQDLELKGPSYQEMHYLKHNFILSTPTNNDQNRVFRQNKNVSEVPPQINQEINKLKDLTNNLQHQYNSPNHKANQTTYSNLSPNKNKSLSIKNSLRVTNEMELAGAKWLKHLGFNALFVKVNRPIYEDPLRNGVLLIHLIKNLQIAPIIQQYFTHPRTVDECRFNIEQALCVLKNAETKIPVQLLSMSEDIIKGNHQVFWGIIYYLMQGCKENYQMQQVLKNLDKYVEDQKILKEQVQQVMLQQEKKSAEQQYNSQIIVNPLPYSKQELKKLEIYLTKWINELQLKNFSGENSDEQQQLYQEDLTFHKLIQQCRTGLMICKVVGCILNSDIQPIHVKPQTEQNCIANIVKALKPLRQNEEVGQKFLWNEKEIFLGNRFCILGLLEDFKRFYDGMPARPAGDRYFDDGPYFGQPLGEFDSVVTNLSNQNKTLPKQSFNIFNQDQSLKKFNTISQSQDFLVNKQLQSSSPKQQNNSNEPFTLMNFVKDNLGQVGDNNLLGSIQFGEKVVRTPKQQLVQFENTTKQSINQMDDNSIDLLRNFGFISESKLYYQNTLLNSGKSQRQREITQSTPQKANPYQQLQTNTLNSTLQQDIGKSKENIIRDWINYHGFIEFAQQLDFNKTELEEFKDGLFLSKLVQKLETREIQGIIQKPKTMASCYVNIRKVIAVLKQKSTMDQVLLVDEDRFFQAKSEFILKLLLAMKQAYKTHNKYQQNLSKAQITMHNNSQTYRSSISKQTNQSPLKQETVNLYYYNKQMPNYIMSPEQRKSMIITSPHKLK